MRLLLDTHVFLWWVEDAPQLSVSARTAVADPQNVCLLSLASCWEMAIKASLGKLKLPSALENFIPEQLLINGFQTLDIDFRHIVRVSGLAFHHRDPFDRLIIAQALEERLVVASADSVFEKYDLQRVW
ncbi:type II toxin-antitoxin system VapC family toxin [Gloeobacter violaceus]|uniref:Gll3555 protein n=1 Tax=Gloeobacter violaceus (strain ATCC 29082 / PCC 7421) TaxID=251221 RepID=Q7NFH0_GLOVI|nr:type II toxin-antitoxin system VapC family toxin [Gloeobacter violaceus]BAC91496.1 gll3555 [Gloeobacter violaceus PCC 7421]